VFREDGDCVKLSAPSRSIQVYTAVRCGGKIRVLGFRGDGDCVKLTAPSRSIQVYATVCGDGKIGV
jgi:hypothetical protein